MATYAARRQSPHRARLIGKEARRIGAADILDIGAHSGTISRLLAAEGFEVVAVDDHYRVPEGDYETMTLAVDADNVNRLDRADVVLALSVLHHMPDWREVFDGLRHVARKSLIVEVPHPHENLRKAKARHELPSLYEAVTIGSIRWIGTTPAVHDAHLIRHLYIVPPLVSGVVFSGGGNHAKTQGRYGDQFEEVLSYRPYPGSLNVGLVSPSDLGAPQIELRPAPKRRYQMWAARLEGINGHAMIPDRAHDNTLEMLAPVNLRDELGLKDGDSVDLEIIW